MKILDSLIYDNPTLNEQSGLALSLLRGRFRDVMQATWAPIVMMAISVGAYIGICLPALYSSSSEVLSVQLREALLFVVGGLAMLLTILAVCYGYATGMISRILYTEALGEPETVAKSSRIINGRLKGLALLVIRNATPPLLYVLAGLALAIGPGVVADPASNLGALTGLGTVMLLSSVALVPFMLFRRSLAITIFAVQDLSLSEALKRSIAYTKFSKLTGTTFLSVAFLSIIATVSCNVLLAELVASISPPDSHPPLYLSLLTSAIQVIPGVFAAGVLTLYRASTSVIATIDARINLEGFDIDILEQRAQTYGKRSRFRI